MPSRRADFSKDFGANAALYQRLRPDYPESVFDALTRATGEARALAVDLGAGGGQATQRLAAHFDRVVAVEPDARMSAANSAANIELRTQGAEAARFADGSVDAVIAATSFHWMDQDLVTARIGRWLRSGGVFFPFMYGVFEFEGPARAVIARHWPKWTPYRDDRLVSRYDPRPAVERSKAFAHISEFSARMTRDYAPEEAAALLATTSYASAYARDHGGAEAYLDALADELKKEADTIRVGFPVSGVVAVKR